MLLNSIKAWGDVPGYFIGYPKEERFTRQCGESCSGNYMRDFLTATGEDFE